jgi:hypothetical protein
VLLSSSRSGGGGSYFLSSSGGGDPASYQLTNQRKTAVFTVDRARVKQALGNPDRYFWRTVTCNFPADDAPDNGARVRQTLHRHDHR